MLLVCEPDEGKILREASSIRTHSRKESEKTTTEEPPPHPQNNQTHHVLIMSCKKKKKKTHPNDSTHIVYGLLQQPIQRLTTVDKKITICSLTLETSFNISNIQLNASKYGPL